MDKINKIDHFLITRFNLTNNNWNKHNVLSLEWIYKRIEIFEQFCYPSVLHQTQQNFKWLIFFDIDTPIEIKNYIAEKYNQTNIHIYYIKGFNELETSCRFAVKSLLKTPFFITSRLDNDDALHYSYIRTVQSLAIAKNKTVIDLTKGYQLHISNKMNYANSFTSRYNPFISLISNADELELIIDKEHLNWNNKDYFYIKYSKKPLWLQLIHDNNQINAFHKSLKTVCINLEEFHINHVKCNTSSLYQKASNFFYAPFRCFFYFKAEFKHFKKRYLF